MLREAVEIVKAMWTEPDATYDGRYYQVAGAQCDPKPMQDPHPPVWIGGSGEQLTLRVVARHANVSNFGGKPDEWRAQARGAPGALPRRRAGRGPDREELESRARGRGTEAEVRAVHEARRVARRGSRSGTRTAAGNLAGTAEQVLERIRTYVDLGVHRTSCAWMPDYPGEETLRRFADEVMPAAALTVSGTRCAGSRGSSGGRAGRRAAPSNINEMMIGNPRTSAPKK